MSKKYSQVFLKNNHIAQKIANFFITQAKNNEIVEIGPGDGALTQFLYPKYLEKYTGIEIDPYFVEIIQKKFKKINIINTDFLKINEKQLTQSYFCGNLPYHISTAILEKVIKLKNFKTAVFMFQKEVAKKIVSTSLDNNYGYLSALINILCNTEYLFEVSKENFNPVPKVDSAVLKITLKDNPPKETELHIYQKFISAAFAYKRKTLVNSLYLSLKIDKNTIINIIENSNLKINIRAEELSPKELFELSFKFENFIKTKLRL
ncbi:MAG: 16S rRNA (adenine(1518)-N(6)/adenine(1519)-N(6))-dimethyltransferase RsmA [Elusimicrobiales bacterium]|nr:16S rRNA (adenine(1518)-N(6)/adenine(1519)-N(6))-dimethyltransferase RsmA [Elusimicrobiales bacterium]